MWILTLVLMVATSSQNRAMTTVVAEYSSESTCNAALNAHIARIDTLTYGTRNPERLVGVILSSCTRK